MSARETGNIYDRLCICRNERTMQILQQKLSMWIFENRLVECAKLALDDFNQDVNAAQSQGMTALMMAARQGHLKLAQLLIAKGARLDAMDTQRSALDVIWGK